MTSLKNSKKGAIPNEMPGLPNNLPLVTADILDNIGILLFVLNLLYGHRKWTYSNKSYYWFLSFPVFNHSNLLRNRLPYLRYFSTTKSHIVEFL